MAMQTGEHMAGTNAVKDTNGTSSLPSMLGLSLLVAVRSAVPLPGIWALKAGQM